MKLFLIAPLFLAGCVHLTTPPSYVGDTICYVSASGTRCVGSLRVEIAPPHMAPFIGKAFLVVKTYWF